MMRKNIYPLLPLLGLALLIGCGSPEEKANKLFVETANFLKMAEEAEKTSFSEALKNYEKALDNLQKIVLKYPSSQMATKMVQEDGFKICTYTLKQLKEEILPEARLRAEAENDPFACAFLVARSVEDPENWTLHAIAVKYAEVGNPNQALQIAEEFEGVGKRYILKDIAVKCAEVGNHKRALDIAKSFEDKDKRMCLLGDIATTYARTEEYNHALQVANEIEDAEDRTFVLGKIAEEYLEAGQYKQFLHVAKSFPIKNIDRSEWLVIFLENVLRSTERGEYDKALQMVEDVKDDVKLYLLVAIADECIRAGEKDKAHQILSQAFQILKLFKPTPEFSIKMAIEIADRYVNAGEKEEAARILSHTLQVVKPTEIASYSIQEFEETLCRIVVKYVEIGQYGKAQEILSQAFQAVRTTFAADAYWKAEMLARIANKYAEIGQYDQALQTAQAIEHECLKTMTLVEIACKYHELGQKTKKQKVLSQALQTAKTIDIRYEEAKARALVSIALAYAEAGKKLEELEKQILHEIIASITPSSGKAKPEELIIGKWREIEGLEIMEFFKGGIVSAVTGRRSMGGNYQFLDEDRIRLEFGGLGALAGPMVCRVSVSKDKLIFTKPDGDVSRYRRIE